MADPSAMSWSLAEIELFLIAGFSVALVVEASVSMLISRRAWAEEDRLL